MWRWAVHPVKRRPPWAVTSRRSRSPARTGASTATRCGARWTCSPACCASGRSTRTASWWAQEIELNLVDARGMPSMRNTDVLDAIADPAWATEVGQFNLEINVPPRQLGGDAFDGLEREIRADLNAADDKARTVGSQPGHGRHPAHAGRDGRGRGRHVGQRALPGAERADLRGPRRGHAHRDRRRRAAAHPRRQHHPRGRVHQRPAAPPGQPGCLRQLLERRPGHRRRPGGAGGQLPVPVRQAAVARDPDHAVRAGHRHPAG